MAIATSTKLIGKNIVLLDGTKTKITDAMATGYKVASRTVRVNSKQVAKKGACYYEIPVTSLRDLVDSEEGYVSFADKAMQKKVGTDAFLEKPAKGGRKPKEETPAPKTTGRKPRQPKEEKEEKTSNVRPKNSRTAKADEPAKPRRSKTDDSGFGALADFLINGGNKRKTVSLTEVDEELAAVITKRLVDTLKESSLAKFDQNNAMIENAFDVQFSTEYDRTGGDIRATLHLKYALTAPEVSPETFEFTPELMKKVKARIGKTFGKKLAAAIAEHLEIESSDLTSGTMLVREGEDGQFVFCGPSSDDNNKAVLLNLETEKFRTVGSASLANYELVVEEAEEEDEEDEEDSEEAEEDDADADANAEAEEDDDADNEEFEYAVVTKKQLANVDKEVTADHLSMLSKLWGVPKSALITGLKLTDGDSEIVFIGLDEDGDLLVIEEGAKEVVMFEHEDIAQLDDYSPVVGDTESDAEQDFEDAGEDLEDLDEDELRDMVVQKGLANVKSAAKMTERKLRSLLKNN